MLIPNFTVTASFGLLFQVKREITELTAKFLNIFFKRLFCLFISIKVFDDNDPEFYGIRVTLIIISGRPQITEFTWKF